MEIWKVMVFIITFSIALSNARIWRHKSRIDFKEYTALSTDYKRKNTCKPKSGVKFSEANLYLENNIHRKRRNKREEVVEKSTRILPDFFLVHNQRTKSNQKNIETKYTTKLNLKDTSYAFDNVKYYTKSHYKNVPIILFPERKHSTMRPTAKSVTIITKMVDHPISTKRKSSTTEKHIIYVNNVPFVPNKRSEFGIHKNVKHLISQPFSPMYYNQIPKPMLHKPANMDNQKQVNFLLSLVPKPKAELIQNNETSFQIHPRYNKSVKDQQIATQSYDPMTKPGGAIENFRNDKMATPKEYELSKKFNHNIKFRVPEPVNIHNKKTTPFPYNMLDHSDEPGIVEKIKSIMAEPRGQMVTKKNSALEDKRLYDKFLKTTPFSQETDNVGIQKVKFLLSQIYNKPVTKHFLNIDEVKRFGSDLKIAREKTNVELAADAFFLLFIYPHIVKCALSNSNIDSYIDKPKELTKKSIFEEFLSKKLKHKAEFTKTPYFLEKYGKTVPKNKPIYIATKETTEQYSFARTLQNTTDSNKVIFVNQNNQQSTNTVVDLMQKSKFSENFTNNTIKNNLSNSEKLQFIHYFNKKMYPSVKYKSIEENTIPSKTIDFSEQYLRFLGERAPVLALYQDAVGTPYQSNQNHNFLRDIFPQQYLDYLNDEQANQKKLEFLQDNTYHEYLKELGEKAAVLQLYPAIDKPDVSIQDGGNSQFENDYRKSELFARNVPVGANQISSAHFQRNPNRFGTHQYENDEKLSSLSKLRYLSLMSENSPLLNLLHNNFDTNSDDSNYQHSSIRQNQTFESNYKMSPEEFDGNLKIDLKNDQDRELKYNTYKKDSFLQPNDFRFSEKYPSFRNMPYKHKDNQDFKSFSNENIPRNIKDIEVGSNEETNTRYNFDNINFVPKNIALKAKQFHDNYNAKKSQYIDNRRFEQIPTNNLNFNSKQSNKRQKAFQDGRRIHENHDWQSSQQISDIIQNRKKAELFGRISSEVDETKNLLDNRNSILFSPQFVLNGEDKRKVIQENEGISQRFENNFESKDPFEIRDRIKHEETRNKEFFNRNFGNRQLHFEPEKHNFDLRIGDKNKKKETLFHGHFDDSSKQDMSGFQKEFRFDVNMDDKRKKKEELFDTINKYDFYRNDNSELSRELKYEDKMMKKDMLFDQIGRNSEYNSDLIHPIKEPRYNYHEINNFISENSIQPHVDISVPIDHYRTDFKINSDIQSKKEKLFHNAKLVSNILEDGVKELTQNNLESNSLENNGVLRRSDRNSKKQQLFNGKPDFKKDNLEDRSLVHNQNHQENKIKYTFIYPSKNTIKHSILDKTTEMEPFYFGKNLQSNLQSETKPQLKYGGDGFDIDWLDFSNEKSDPTRKIF